MKSQTVMAVVAFAAALGAIAPAVLAQDVGQSAIQSMPADNQIGLDVAQQGGMTYVRLRMKSALSDPPASFSVAEPPRIAFDFSPRRSSSC